MRACVYLSVSLCLCEYTCLYLCVGVCGFMCVSVCMCACAQWAQRATWPLWLQAEGIGVQTVALVTGQVCCPWKL